MDELYSGNTNNANLSYDMSEDSDMNKEFFREFDYGIDSTDNVILIQDEITSGLAFDIVSKVRLLKKINGI